MTLEYLAQAEKILSKCGRPMSPGGVSAVAIPKGFLMAMVLPASVNLGQSVATFSKEITGDTPWVLRAISFPTATGAFESTNPGSVRIQVQLPNGKQLFGGNGVSATQFAWVGSYRWCHRPELYCEPGSKITVSLTNTAQSLTTAVPINLLFEGAYLYFMSGGRRVPPPARIPKRYLGSLNENILAPAWMSNEGIVTPDGYADEYFVYATPDPADSPALTTWTISGGTVGPSPLPFQIQIDPGYDFFVRRMLFDVQFTGDAVGTVLAKLRTGAGYSLNDSYIDAARLLCGAEFGGRWKVQGSDTVFIDTQLVDFSGNNGTVSFQVFLEGYRRRRA